MATHYMLAKWNLSGQIVAHWEWGLSMNLQELDLLRWVHILAMVYWLGGEWGVNWWRLYARYPLFIRQNACNV